MLNELIKILEDSPEFKAAWYDLADAITVQTLKETYLNTINGGFSNHPEDIASNLEVNSALAVCLKYFMFKPDAEEFLKEAENERTAD